MSAIQKLLTDHIDIWTAADSEKKSGRGRSSSSAVSVYGIKKLRELILELAVRGKLVPQDPSDEPASELLDRILEKKAMALPNSNQRKKRIEHSKEDDNHKQVAIPASWSYAKLDDLVNIINGRAYKKEELLDAGTPVLRVGNLFTSDHWYYSDLKLEPEKYCDAGDLLFAWSASFGPFIWKGEKSIFHYHIWKLDFYSVDLLYKRYLYTFLLEQTQKIKASGHGVSMIHMTKGEMEKLAVPIPPLAEQHRIVAKVDELMALCDQLEAQHNNAAEAHEKLVSHLLGMLTQSQSAEDFSENWQRIVAHFDTLFTTEASIDALKQTLLQLAVMGKLVPQDPSEEPARELLNRIAEMKYKATKVGKRTRPKQLPVIGEDGEPFKLPAGWEWCYLSDIAVFENGDRSSKYPNSEDLVESGVPFFGAPDIQDGKLSFNSELRFISPAKFLELSNGKLVDRDFVMLLRGTVGKTAQFIANAMYKTGFINAQMLIVRLVDVDLDDYLRIYFESRLFKGIIAEQKSGAVIQQVPAGKVAECLFSLPPKNERVRIVAQLHELMAICDQFRSRLTVLNQLQQKLADVMIEQAVA